MTDSETQRNTVRLEFPKNITETGVYPVRRTINGEEDVIRMLIWSDEDVNKGGKSSELEENAVVDSSTLTL